MSQLELSDLRSQSFANDRPDAQRHALTLVGTPGDPSHFADLAMLALRNKPERYSHPQGPLPRIDSAIIFTTARHAIPYGDAFRAFWATVGSHYPELEVPKLDIVDPSIRKNDSGKEFEATEHAQLERIAKLAEEAGDNTLAYVFDEFVIMGRALRGGVRIVREAGFRYVSELPLHAPMGEDGVYIRALDLPFDRDRKLGNQLVPNDELDFVEALSHDMTLIGSLAGQNYIEFTSAQTAATAQ